MAKEQNVSFDVYRKAGQWYWTFTAGNGRIMADSSHGYSRKSDAEQAVDRVKDLIRKSNWGPWYDEKPGDRDEKKKKDYP